MKNVFRLQNLKYFSIFYGQKDSYCNIRVAIEKMAKIKYGKASESFEESSKNANEENQAETPSESLKAMTDDQKTNRKRRIKEALMAEHKEKLSRQKRKRFDKFVERQMKREEKEILLKKLEQTRVDTSILTASKLIGTGKQTKREQFLEALELEKQGRGDEKTKEILSDQREVKTWDESESEEDNDQEEEFKSTDQTSAGFIDYRPAQGLNKGFGFGDIAKKPMKAKAAKSYSWRNKVEDIENKRKKSEEEGDFESSDEEMDGSSEVDESDDSSNMDQGEAEIASSSDEENLEQEEEEKAEAEADDDDEDEEDDDDEDEDDDEEEEEEEEEEEVEKGKLSKKALSFREWADDQVREMEGREKFVALEGPQMEYTPIIREEDLDDNAPKEYIPINEDLKRKVFTVEIDRDDEIQQARMQLPVFSEEHRIMEAIHHNDCVIICGETGSGKTTQVPQFLFESGYGSKHSETPGMIGITQPRRVAAVAMAQRVANELGNYGHRVGHQIRFDTAVKEDTAMKFMTDGVLLRELMTDFLLTKYSALIIDEAHERNVNTDILIGTLSRVLKLRRQYHEKDPKKYSPLKLIIMSATLRVSDFSENKGLFATPPPILKVEARQYPVSIHFDKRTSFNYNEEAFKKACKIHRKLPPGGILIFMTGKNEITDMVKRLRKEFPTSDKSQKKTSKTAELDEEIVDVRVSAKNADIEPEEIDFEVSELKDDFDEMIELNEDGEEEEEEGFEESLEEGQTDNDPLYVLPLYSLLPTNEQMKVFKDPPAGSRMCIVATNVAETSLTIPGIRYVVDCGRSKERHYNEETGVQSFEIGWIAKASADQRAGRAGRTGPGHCYRLFSSAVYESEFLKFSKPEILRMPVESVVLSMKSMGIDNIVNFPFPTPPDSHMLNKAEKLLQYLGALDKKASITDLGRKMSIFPLSPRFAKMLIIGNQHNCLPYMIALVSGLSVGDPFITENDIGINEKPKVKKVQAEGDDDSDVERQDDDYEEQESQAELEAKRRLRSKFNKANRMFSKLDKFSDAFKLLSAICAIDHVSEDSKVRFYEDNFLRPKIMEEIYKLRKQLTYIVNVNTSKDGIAESQTIADKQLKLGKPSGIQVSALKQMILAGFIDQVAIRADLFSKDINISNKTTILNVPYCTLFPSKEHDNDTIDPYVYIHASSILNEAGELPPPYLVYQSLNLGSNRTAGKITKLRMKPLTDVGGKQLANIGKGSNLVTYSKPLGYPYAPKEISSTERECYVVPRFGAAVGSGGVGWDLPAVKVVQKKLYGSWVVK